MQQDYDLVVVGHISYDENRTKHGTKVVPSGTAYLATLPASLYSKKIGLVTRIGEDYDIGLLERLDINLSGVHMIKGGKTSRFFNNYLNEECSIKEFKAEFNVGADLVPEDVPGYYLNSKYIHIATMPPQQQRRFIKYFRSKSQAKISVDTLVQYIEEWEKEVADVLSMADIVFLDRKEYDLIGNLEGKDMVIKKGAEGAEYRYGGKIIKTPAPKVEVVDKTGSGDVLAGVFLVLLAIGKSAEHALKEAVDVASKSITEFGVDSLLEG